MGKTEGIYEQVGVAMTCRSFDEYVAMFRLTDKELSSGPILDVAAGGSSFVAAASAAGYEVRGVDPRYDGDPTDWIREAGEEIEASTAKLAGLVDRFDWTYYGSLENHRLGRERSLALFRADLVANASFDQSVSRYVGGRLPQLPFEDDQFGLVLCSHFLFLYAEQFDFDFHVQAVRELLRVCRPGGQVRIYPLMSLRWEPYERLGDLLAAVREDGAEEEVLASGLPFIPGSEYYLKLLKNV
ncbi:methyltransferase domain-containing protein [Paenibacillus sp. LHD-117]|uniref:methyltransferase domain-containing protein n=1 Tax=Paenibacillus sp. LHD-117 TaxID=3071412 RepID=UPI0027E1A66F|nr:methyltransferase domain-containing protein [Paenibacillus sp. LHD-117]MDQ6421846.1 methyltransferase domain-containing protein [Paenibacillus sp. LHD-117]